MTKSRTACVPLLATGGRGGTGVSGGKGDTGVVGGTSVSGGRGARHR